MKLFKFLFVVMSLLSAIPCFGRRVHLDGNWKHSKKSILVDLPMDASIEEASGELIVNFHENVGNVRVIVTSSTGEVIYNEMVQTSTMPSLVIPLKDQEKGLGKEKIIIDENAKSFLVDQAGGDARSVLNALELAYLTTERNKKGIISITLEVAEQCIQKKAIRYDKNGDNHYDTISAFIESMKHTDPDATLYYLARMLIAGEDVKYIARRICVCASEDIGLANSQALVVATNAFLAVERIGMPEAAKILAHAALYVCCSPKSDAGETACDTILQTLDLLFSVCELADPHTRNFVLALGTVDFTDDQVLRNVYQTTGQVTGVGGTKRGIGHTFSCSMCGHEVFQYLKTFTEV